MILIVTANVEEQRAEDRDEHPLGISEHARSENTFLRPLGEYLIDQVLNVREKTASRKRVRLQTGVDVPFLCRASVANL